MTSRSTTRSTAPNADHPLTNLDATRNVVPTIDFRSLYATGLSWLGVPDTAAALGGHFDAVPALT